MRVLISLVLCILVAFCHGQEINGCDLSQEAIMKTSMECLSHDPSLLLQLLGNTDNMANMKFVCSNQKAVIDVALCMEKKMVECLPKEVQPLVLRFIVKERLEAALSFACNHQAELLDQCMDETAGAEVAKCITDEAQTLMASFAYPQYSTFGAQDVLCKYSEVFKKCLASHSGQCPKTYIDVYDELFEMILPEHHCNKQGQGVFQNGPASKLLGSLLMRGQPLLASQAGKMGPIYKMGHN